MAVDSTAIRQCARSAVCNSARKTSFTVFFSTQHSTIMVGSHVLVYIRSAFIIQHLRHYCHQLFTV
ncbi:hypothetical protein OUZ56_000760 [Daphnia magna]|uniref:Uncharacterized protein n=1 Tax=Daphnia magna TaxID=35525 RepID=A0ABR0A1A1_9CRUS|nr:hypothetical protein OUZ56_000760 [Daphnia magna]